MRRFPALLLTLPLLGCAEDLPTAAPPPGGEPATARITCTAEVPAGRIRCDEPGARRNLIVGGQHLNVRLISSGVAYGDEVFLFYASVQNLLGQRMGTPDGTTVYGVNVFFEAMPTAVAGSGEIEVLEAETGSFTRASQPYYHYPEIVEPGGTSGAQQWRLQVPETVETFQFTVLVETRLPAESAVLRWRKLAGDAAGGLDLRGVWGPSRHNAFAVGSGGVILHHDGSAWRRMASPTTRNLLAVGGAGELDAYAAGDQGTLLRYDGARWSPVGHGTEYTLRGVWAASPYDVWVAGTYHNPDNGFDIAVLLHSTDRGQSFGDHYQYGESHNGLAAVAGSGAEVWAAGSALNPNTGLQEAFLVHSDDSGQSWSDTLLAHTHDRVLNGIWMSGDTVVAVGQQGTAGGVNETVILRSTDGGASWMAGTSPGRGARSISGAGDDLFVTEIRYDPDAGGVRASLLRSTDAGASWTQVFSPAPGNPELMALWGSNPDNVWAVGQRGTVVRFDGAAWSSEEMLVGDALWGAWSPSVGSLVAVGTRLDDGVGRQVALIRRVEGGFVTEETLPAAGGNTDRYLFGAWGAGDQLWAVGEDVTLFFGGSTTDGLVLHSEDGGASWTASASINPDGSRSLRAVWGTASGTVFAVGSQAAGGGGDPQGVILRRKDGAWTTIPRPHADDRYFTGVWAAGTEVWVVGRQMGAAGWEGIILHSTDEGETWIESTSPHPAGRYLNGVWGTGTGELWLVGQQVNTGSGRNEGVILHSSDGGETWSETVSSGSEARALHTVLGYGPNRVYAAGEPGLLLYFDGNGWAEMSSGAIAPLRALAGAAPREVFAVGGAGYVLQGSR